MPHIDTLPTVDELPNVDGDGPNGPILLEGFTPRFENPNPSSPDTAHNPMHVARPVTVPTGRR